ncbi:hypothetical protein HZA41_03055 [Candidatus Peregrinibacteria bacterium]|nr:hypothetical protein [Candidatus Peregrinibacteria bacterium]
MREKPDSLESEQLEPNTHEFFVRTNALVGLQRLCNQFPTRETREMRAMFSRILEEERKKGQRLVISLCGALGSGLYTEGGDIDIGLCLGDMTQGEVEKILKEGLLKKYQEIPIDFWGHSIPFRHLEMTAEILSSETTDSMSRYHRNILTHFLYVNGLSEVRMGQDISHIDNGIREAMANNRISPMIFDVCLMKLKERTPLYYASFTKYLERIASNPEFQKKEQRERLKIFQRFANFCQIIFRKKI